MCLVLTKYYILVYFQCYHRYETLHVTAPAPVLAGVPSILPGGTTRPLLKVSYHGDFVTCHLVHFIVRFVHFTKLVSSSANVDFSPLYGSLRISVEGLYSLSYSLQASDNSNYIPTSQHVNDEAVTGVASLQSGLYLYPGTPGEISLPLLS